MKRVFLLGAGFSKAISEGKTPLNKELFKKIKIECKIDRDLITKYPTDDIERFITSLDLELAEESLRLDRKKKLTEERRNIVENIRNILDINKIQPDNTQCIDKFSFLLKSNDTIINLNYDLLLEHYLWKKRIWSPKWGYTQIVDNCVFEPQETNKDRKNIVVIKPHGSLQFFEGIVGNSKYGTTIVPQVNDELFPGVNYHAEYFPPHVKTRRVVLPGYIKTDNIHLQLMKLWQIAFDKVKGCNTLTILGCSLQYADVFLWLLLSYCFPFEKGNLTKIVIVDTKANELTEKIFFALGLNDGFKKYIIPVPGKIEDNFDKLNKFMGEEEKGDIT